MAVYNSKVPIIHESVRIEELHMHLGDLLPQNMNYSQDDNVVLKIVVHFSDPYGRPRSKTITLPSTTIL